MAEQIYPPLGPTMPGVPPKGFVQTPTTTFTQFDSSGMKCVGVNIQNPSFDNTPAVVNAYLYVQVGGVNLAEIAPGETKFIQCSNTNQIKLGILSGAGGTTAFARIEVIQVNGNAG